MPAPGIHPALTQARRQALVESLAIDHLARHAVPGLEGLHRLRALDEQAIRIVLDQRRPVARAQRHQPGLVRIRHARAQRHLQLGHHHHGLQARLGLEGQLQRLQRQPGARAAGNLQRLQLQRLHHLQQTVIGGRLHRHHVPGRGHGCQRQAHSLRIAGGRQHIARGHADARRQRVPGHGLLEQRVVALVGQQRAALRQQLRVFAQQARHGLVQKAVVEQLRRWRAAAHIQVHLGLAPALEQQGNVFVDAHKVGLGAGLHRLAQVRLAGQRHPVQRPRIAHKVAHARARLQMPLLLQVAQHLQGGGQADLVAAHQLAHGGHALARLQGPQAHGLGIVTRQATVQGQ